MTRTLTASPLELTTTRRLEWLYADRIPLRTGTILAGQGGIAKSTIISDIVARATRGELPGTFEGTPVAVGIISPEDDTESILVPRLMAAGADLSCIRNLSVRVTDGDRSWDALPTIGDDLADLGTVIRDEGIRLLVVDPLVSIMSGNSISQSDVRRNFDPLSALAKEHDFALLAVAHFGKSGAAAGDSLSGSHAFRDIARVLIVAAIDDETGDRILTVEKSNYSPLLPSDAYAIENATVKLHDGSTQQVGRAVLRGRSTLTVQDILERDNDSKSKLSEYSQRIIAEVERHPGGVGAEAVAEALGLETEKVRRYLNRAAGRGDIDRASRGVFTPVSRVPLSRIQDTGQKRHIIYRDTCTRCGEPLDVVEPGQTTHPNCEPVPRALSAEEALRITASLTERAS